MHPAPPKYTLRFLQWFCKASFLEEIEGDLVELYEKRSVTSPRVARWQFTWDVMKTFRWVNLRPITINNLVMNSIRNYIKVYFRRFRKETTHYLINILGLATGFAVLFFILTYVNDEYSVDTYHSKSDRIYRLLEKSTSDDGEVAHYSATSNMLFDALKNDYPEVEETARMIYLGSGGLKYEQNLFNDRSYAFATRSIFDILDFEIIAGDARADFNGVVGVVMNETTAKILFGDDQAVGKVVDLPGKVEGAEVLAVYKDLPKSSSYQFNTIYVSKFDQFPRGFARWFASYDSRGMTTWVLLKENVDPSAIEAKRDALLEKYFEEDQRKEHEFYLQPIGDMHLGSSHLEEAGPEPLVAIPYSKPEFVNVIFLIGLFVIIVAALNYINLSSVQALKRSLEAGIRKVNGATIGQLRFQLFIETFMSLFIAYLLAIALVVIFRGQFLELANKAILLEDFFTKDLIIFQAAVFIAILILSSIVPALYYSK
ncbi:MAG: ABC transporter permease, partial [Bacteroidota bacterium]